MQTTRDLHRQSSTESVSPQFCRKDSRDSSDSPYGRFLIQARDERRKTLPRTQLLAKLARRVLARNFAYADAVKNAFGRIVLLNENRRVGSVQPVAQPFGIAAVMESPYLHGEKSRRGIHVAQDFHMHRHDAGP